MYLHMFDIVDAAFIMEDNWSSANFCRIFPREKEVACNKCYAHTAFFTLWGSVAQVRTGPVVVNIDKLFNYCTIWQQDAYQHCMGVQGAISCPWCGVNGDWYDTWVDWAVLGLWICRIATAWKWLYPFKKKKKHFW